MEAETNASVQDAKEGLVHEYTEPRMMRAAGWDLGESLGGTGKAKKTLKSDERSEAVHNGLR